MTQNSSGKVSDENRMNNRYCPKCGEKLKAVTYENSTASFNDYNSFSAGVSPKNYMTLFMCYKCRLKYTIQDLIKIGKIKKHRIDER